MNKIKRKCIFIASDHAGYNLKKIIINYFKKNKKKYLDLGTNNLDSVDYPDFANKMSKKIKNINGQFGVLICGSGTGMTIAANRYNNMRVALCYDVKSTKLSRMHNNANVMALGARLTKKNVALKCVNIFIKTKFDGGRHLRRLKKI